MTEPCPLCGEQANVRTESGFWIVTCDNCYDGAPDAGEQPLVWSNDRNDAVSAWDEFCHDWSACHDPNYWNTAQTRALYG